MYLSTWNPLRERQTVFGAFHHPLVRSLGHSLEFDWAPSVDITEAKDAFFVKAELPGVNRDDVSVSFEGGILTIRGEKKPTSDERENRQMECSYGSFVRRIRLPEAIEADGIEAEYENGILNLKVPKPAAARARQIEVKTK